MNNYYYNEETRKAWHELGAAFLEAIDELTLDWEELKHGTTSNSNELFQNAEPLEIEFPF